MTLAIEAFEISRRVFGPDYPHTLATAHALAVSLRAAGDFRTALEQDMDTVRRRTASTTARPTRGCANGSARTTCSR
ncbi:tetratricopeptide repeat protein [Actinoplanes sp. TRM 88003]|uniref:Tetratricopeptide repeat protein n=1 Tax=Paractinoplanes aksuensis TaxID=2939490 RepID=A0ABT1DVW8_9ACTN|nr:tetratricopeptide repeat protein [Actinoplanes aksuensis]MCO8274973.1 tetratricopeptide repeat protein [Actinoplanes aksuensis]